MPYVGYVYVHTLCFAMRHKAYSAWASALLILPLMGNARAPESGMSDKYRLPRFSFFLTKSLKGKRGIMDYYEDEIFFVFIAGDAPIFRSYGQR